MIYLVRHGESEWNAARLTQGQTPHPGLTDLGRAQSEAAARALLADAVTVPEVIASDLVRAVQTADIVAAALGAAVRVDPRLREQSLGTFEGLSYADSFAAGSALDWSDPDLRVGGGESLRDVQRRMLDVLAELAHGADVVVVSHGDAIRIVLGHLAGHALGAAPWIEVGNGAVVAVDGAQIRWLTPQASATAQ